MQSLPTAAGFGVTLSRVDGNTLRVSVSAALSGGNTNACVQWAAAGFALNRDLLIFAIVSVLAFLVLRKLFVRPADQEESPDDVNRY